MINAMETYGALSESVIVEGHKLVWDARFPLGNDTGFAKE